MIRLPAHPAAATENAPATQVTLQVGMLLLQVSGEMTRQAIQETLGLSDREHFRKTYLVHALEKCVIEMTLPDKPR